MLKRAQAALAAIEETQKDQGEELALLRAIRAELPRDSLAAAHYDRQIQAMELHAGRLADEAKATRIVCEREDERERTKPSKEEPK